MHAAVEHDLYATRLVLAQNRIHQSISLTGSRQQCPSVKGIHPLHLSFLVQEHNQLRP